MHLVYVNYHEIDNSQLTALFTPKFTGASSSADPLFPVMVMCKESDSDPSTRFVRIVCNTPEPMAVLTFDWTLTDLKCFLY